MVGSEMCPLAGCLNTENTEEKKRRKEEKKETRKKERN
jgi:hypothetical protein